MSEHALEYEDSPAWKWPMHHPAGHAPDQIVAWLKCGSTDHDRGICKLQSDIECCFKFRQMPMTTFCRNKKQQPAWLKIKADHTNVYLPPASVWATGIRP